MIIFCRACLLGLRWTSQKPKGKEGAKDDCCREGDFFHSAVKVCRKTQKHRLGIVTFSTHRGVCLGGSGVFLDRTEAKRRKTAVGSPKGENSESIYRIGGFFDRITESERSGERLPLAARRVSGSESIYRIEAKRRKTAAGSPEGERNESINKILSLGKLL